MLVSRRNYKKGFTLVELLVVISIFAILTGVVLLNQNKFNSTILLTNLAYDTALTIRQAQTYGINIKEFNDNPTITTSNRFFPYGVHFDTTNSENKKSFILFADINYDYNSESGDGLYNGLRSADPIPDLLKCEADKGCVNRYSIKRGNYIMAICMGELPKGENGCSAASPTAGSLDVSFTRPNPDAHIKFNGALSESEVATIILTNSEANSFRKVIVRSNGLIQIGDN